MKLFLVFAALIVALAGASAFADEKEPFPDIQLAKEVTAEMMSGILAARGPKDPADVWKVDLLKGDVRIRKSRKDNVVYAPGASVEFWYKDRKTGQWKGRPTA